jgi:5-methylcytosine-specific restriction enzyme A
MPRAPKAPGHAEREPWSGTTRRASLPANWRTIRRQILDRDEWQCTDVTTGQRCTERATEVDHIGDRDDHSPANLRALCTPHHRSRSGRQGAAARPRASRPSEPHPGLL